MKTSKLLISSLLAAAAMSVSAYGATPLSGTAAEWAYEFDAFAYKTVTSQGAAKALISNSPDYYVTNNDITGSSGSLKIGGDTVTEGKVSGVLISNANSGTTNFATNITGSGVFAVYFASTSGTTYNFTKDVSGFSGDFYVKTFESNRVNTLKFSGTGTSAISGTGNITSNCKVEYAVTTGDVTVANSSLSVKNLTFGGGANYTVLNSVSGYDATASNNTLTISAGTTTFTGSIANFGTITVASGATADFSNTTFKLGAVSADSVTTTISNSGTVTFGAGTIFDIDSYVEGAQLLGGMSGQTQTFTVANLSIGGYLVNQRGSAVFSVSESGVLTLDSYTASDTNYSLTWNGGDSGVWKVGGNGWTTTDTTGEVTFQNGDSVMFGTGTTNAATLEGSLKVGTLTISDATTLSVADGSAASVSASTLSLGANLTLNGGVTLAVTTFASSITQNSTVDYSNLSGTGTLSLGLRTDNGVGFNLSNFEGTIRVERGTGVTAASRFQLNTSTLNANARIVVADGNDLVFNDDTNKNVSNSVTFEGSGTIHVNGDNTITAGTNVCTGTLSGNVVVAGTLTKAGGGVLTLSGNASISALGVSGGTLNLNGTQNVGTSLTANSGTINIGSGWTLTSTASVGGTVNIGDGGVWEVVGQNNSTSRIVGTVNVNAGGTLNNAGHDALGYNTNGAMTNATIVARGEEGNLARIVIADVSGSAGASMTFGQTFRLNGYTEVLSGVSGSSFNTFFGSVVATGTNNTISSEVKLRKAFTVQVTNEGDELEISGVLSKHTDGNNGLTKTGSGTLVLSGANTYDCATTIEGGVLTVKNSSALGTGVLNAAGGTGVDSVTLKVAQDGSGNALTIANNISVSADKTLILESANVGNALTGVISGEGALKFSSGTLKVSQANTFTGGVEIAAGVVEAANAAALGAASNAVRISGGKLKIGDGDAAVTLAQTNIEIVLGESYAKPDLVADATKAAILGTSTTAKSSLASGAVTITVEAADAVALAAATEQTQKMYQIFDLSTISLDGTTVTFELGESLKNQGYTGYDFDANTGTLILTVPEPSAFGLLAGAGALALVAARRRRRKKA